MKIRNTILTAVLGMLSAMVFTCAGNVFHAESLWDSVTEGVWQDPETKDFYFRSVDKERSSDIYYRTFGFTFADAYKDASGNVTETGLGEFNWSLYASQNEFTTRELGNGIIETTWRIPYETIMEQIKATSPEWYNKVMNPNGEIYLKLDAIIGVHDATKYGDLLQWSCGFDPLTGLIDGQFWDKYNMQELYNLYGWDPSYFDNHFD